MLNAVRGLKKNKDGVFFLEPVDPVKFNIPAYPQIITKPMDLATVETKLIVSDPRGAPKDKSRMGKWDESKGRYSNVAEITLDVRQIFWNTARFNGMEHLVTQAAKRLDAVFTKNVNNIPPEVSPQARRIVARAETIANGCTHRCTTTRRFTGCWSFPLSTTFGVAPSHHPPNIGNNRSTETRNTSSPFERSFLCGRTSKT
jgi:hypothetical protein